MNSPATESVSFPFSHVSALLKEPIPLDWLVQDYLLPESLVMLFGEPACGKSLLALRWSVELVLNDQPVFIIAGEGHFGFSRRLKALATEIDCEDELAEAPLIISDNGTALLDSEKLKITLDSMDEQVKEYGKPKLIIIDTLNRNFGPGEENSASNVSNLIQALDSIRERYKTTILIVHHSGHTKQNRARGSSALLGAVDTELCLSKSDEEHIRILEVTKMKDATTPEPKAFTIKQVELPWSDTNGNFETSVIIEPSDRPCFSLKNGGEKKRYTKPMQEGIASMKTALAECGILLPWGDSSESDPKKVVMLEDWRVHYYALEPKRDKGTTRKYFERARKELLAAGKLKERDGYFWFEDELKNFLKTNVCEIKKPVRRPNVK